MLIKSKFVTVDGRTILQDAVVRVRGATVTEVRPARRGDRVDLDAGRALLMPGLVNAHCHLEQSYLHGRLRPGRPFAGWLRALVPTSRGRSPARWKAAVRAGLARLARHGTTAVGDICNRAPMLIGELRRDPIRKVVYSEVLGPFPQREEQTWRAAARLREGVSPHAPYTTSPDAYRRCVRSRMPMATHVAETREELRYLRTMDGDLRRLLEHFEAPPPFRRPPRTTPIRYLDRLGVLKPRVVLIHTNYLTAADVALIARRGCATVFCPGSHAFFGHRNHPVRRLRRAGVRVALGTDSLASNRDLSMLREMRLLREGTGIDAPTALRMATRDGAAALFGRRARIGVLRRGWAADLTAVSVPRGADPLETATLSEPQVKFAMAAGRWVRRPSPTR